MNLAVCTLFEKHFHLGAAVLFNSLVARGFDGRFWAGFRGELPPWAANAERTAHGWRLRPGGGPAELRLVRLETELHFTHYKPEWMLQVLETLDPNCDGLCYFDPDIVVKCRWGYFGEWVEHGIALCGDINYWMPASHPLRHGWMRFGAAHGWSKRRDLEGYYNGGFLGVTRARRDALALWRDIVHAVESETGSLKGWRTKDRTHRFSSANQDGLNVMAMVTPHPVACMGPDAMDFVPGGEVMAHAVGKRKPWQRCFVREALAGFPPASCDRLFWQHATAPISAFDPATVKRRRFAVACASFIGRFYRRS